MLRRTTSSFGLALVILAIRGAAADGGPTPQRPADLGQRVESFSSLLLGRPYLRDPLGEGRYGTVDRDPQITLKHFDCTTYVETVLALALSPEGMQSEVLQNLARLRYRNGRVDYFARNHFIDADWIPNNRWLLEDVTARLGGEAEVTTATALVDKAAWYEKNGQESPDREATREVSLPYVKLSAIFDDKGAVVDDRILRRMPDVAVVNIVRPNWDRVEKIGTSLNVSHQGIVVRKADGQIYLRHASETGESRVVEILFTEYLKGFLESPTVRGFNVLQIRNS
ncbi:MAG TPA: N-acetylmuramoyl-L-alanine amidase-like domain-containing protein [Bdellovibrionota bacterium]|nr:N-acetylmuramoyl-L-alanine amidase-like domain-containing protein [Bdellovibrionota bacterium]